jgi:phage shock protein E
MELAVIWIVGVVVVAIILMKRTALASPDMLRKHLQEGALVIDVRSLEEYRSGHAPGALNIPLNELSDKLPPMVPDKEKVLLLHCLSGMRSRNGQRQLQRLGYKNVFNLGSLARAKQIVNEARNH